MSRTIRLGMKRNQTTGWICDSMHYFHAGNSSLQYCRSDFHWSGCGNAGKCSNEYCVSAFYFLYGNLTAAWNSAVRPNFPFWMECWCEEKEKESAEWMSGNGICLMQFSGLHFFAVTTIFLTPMLKFFGATSEVLPYAQEYTRITAIGFPFLIANTGDE